MNQTPPENEAQYIITKRWRDKFKAHVERLTYADDDIDPILRKIELDSARSMVETLNAQMKAYEAKTKNNDTI